MVTIRSDTRRSTSTSGTISRRPGSRTPTTRPRRNSTPFSYCWTIRTDRASPSRTSTASTTTTVVNVDIASSVPRCHPTMARQGCRGITATPQVRRPPAGILAYPLAATVTVATSIAATRQAKTPAGREERWPVALTTGGPGRTRLGEASCSRRDFRVEGTRTCCGRARRRCPSRPAGTGRPSRRAGWSCATATGRCCTASTWSCHTGWWWASWAPTGPARPPPWRSLRATGAAPPARPACWAWTRPPAAGSCGSGSASCSRRPATTRT